MFFVNGAPVASGRAGVGMSAPLPELRMAVTGTRVWWPALFDIEPREQTRFTDVAELRGHALLFPGWWAGPARRQ